MEVFLRMWLNFSNVTRLNPILSFLSTFLIVWPSYTYSGKFYFISPSNDIQYLFSLIKILFRHFHKDYHFYKFMYAFEEILKRRCKQFRWCGISEPYYAVDPGCLHLRFISLLVKHIYLWVLTSSVALWSFCMGKKQSFRVTLEVHTGIVLPNMCTTQTSFI